MTQKLRLFVPILFLIISACGPEHKPVSRPLSPRITSNIQQFSVQIPQDDSHFIGAWSGSQFDGATYRSLLSGGGSLVFDLPESATLLLKIRLRAETPCQLNIFLNDHPLKTIPLSLSPPRESRLLLPKKLLLAGRNRIRFFPDTLAKIRFYGISFSPARTREETQPQSPLLQLPARLHYRVRTGGGALVLRFSEAIPKITVNISGGNLSARRRTWTNRSEIRIEISSESNRFRHISVELQGAPVTIRILESTRTIPSPETNSLSGKALIARAASSRMNVLIILLDSARADRLSCYGYHRKTTPHIDRLARQGLRFSNAWSEAAYTLASTATLFSGLAPDQHNAVSNYYGGLNQRITTMAEAFQQAGYFTAAVSAIPYCGRAFQMDQGFVIFNELFTENPQPMAEEFPSHFREIVQKARKAGKPSFTYPHVREPHIDYLMKPPWRGTFQSISSSRPDPEFQKRLKEIYFGRGIHARGKYSPQDIRLLNDVYDENLLSADAIIGQLLEILTRNDISDQTLVIVLGDHGEGLYEHGQIGHNTVIHPEGLHIPLVMAIPGGKAGGKINSHPVFSSDLTATLMREFTGNLPAPLKGKGLFQTRPIPAIVSRTIFFSQYHLNWSIMEYPFQAIISGHGERRSIQVFNLRKDPRALQPIHDPDGDAYFLNRLQDVLKNRRLIGMDPTASRIREKEVRSLKSLGYL